jgi:phosphatidylserine/phosphatidylglycerophosphate/cardiolipin synthase-like enzyme
MEDVGIGIHKMKHLKLHAKVLLADKTRAVVGSINAASTSFEDRRELAIQSDDSDVVDRLAKVLHDDWHNSRALGLSDRAVFSDLEHHPTHGASSRPAPLAASPTE